MSGGSGNAAGASGNAAGAGGMSNGTLLGDVSEIPVGGGKVFMAQKVVVTQPVKGEFLAFSAVCTHVGCIVDKVANGEIFCPCHGSIFKTTNGAVVTGPASGPLPAKKISTTGGKITLQ
jgi:Rieske Fe-S protein